MRARTVTPSPVETVLVGTKAPDLTCEPLVIGEGETDMDDVTEASEN